jgi:aminodeoxyfutalosine synthase
MAGGRLSFDDGLRVYRSRALMAAGALAQVVRERKNGTAAYFVRNMHLNPTNVCTADCKFCGFYRPYRHKEQGWTWDLERSLGEVRANLSDAITEVHIVGGHNPDYPYAFYLDLIRGIHELKPGIHVKAFTCAEYDFFAKRFKKEAEAAMIPYDDITEKAVAYFGRNVGRDVREQETSGRSPDCFPDKACAPAK